MDVFCFIVCMSLSKVGRQVIGDTAGNSVCAGINTSFELIF